LDTIRLVLGGIRVNGVGDDADDEDIPMLHDIDQKKDRWDCETILSTLHAYYYGESDVCCGRRTSGTYSNLENHSRLIRAKEADQYPEFECILAQVSRAPMCRVDRFGRRARMTEMRKRITVRCINSFH
jgi:protein LTV1